jgi:hypothetical protein
MKYQAVLFDFDDTLQQLQSEQIKFELNYNLEKA